MNPTAHSSSVIGDASSPDLPMPPVHVSGAGGGTGLDEIRTLIGPGRTRC